ncbi:GNAT family N-acetyltransferase [Rhodococcus qingshengii]|uniref:GNAT family N-acetyltransferase n=1 Tax=Rhodococcus qingshengii TaxID=334542 RepID=A0A2A5J397_RHOSG|nr:GNAT family N-acetyltransferase [Rhodococcus qingshengii]PCK24055.1 GNAT family N-acetyltransferase [Rhodococcus qingshengii]
MSCNLTTDPAKLTTDRLILRSWTSEEAAAVLGDRRQADWADDFPSENDKVIPALFAEHPAWLGPYGQRLIVERATGLVVGGIGLFWPPKDGQLEIGYGIVASRRGQGFAAEATRALTEFALAVPEIHTIYANVELANPASVRVLETAGFDLAGQSRGPEGEHLARYRAVADRR